MRQTLLFSFRKIAFLKLIMLLFGMLLITNLAHGQCPNRVTFIHPGTQNFDCTDVTITTDGNVLFGYGCNNFGPYFIGNTTESSVTFSFSKAVSAIALDIEGFDNRELIGEGHEEVTIEINGAPYPFPNAGSPGFCPPPHAIVTPGGNLMAPGCNLPPSCRASCRDVTIYENIKTITVKDILIGPYMQAGVIFSLYFCCSTCLVDAGEINAAPIFLCPEGVATVSPAIETCVPQGYLLQYALYSDPSDPLGSIILIRDTASFSFDPLTMQPNTTYYIAAVAGFELNGNVDLNIACLDFSNAIEVVWWPLPAVVFSIDNPDVCKGDCVDVHVEFSGEPPFSLAYTSTYTGQILRTFYDLTGIIQLCIPSNAPPGSLNIQAIKLADKHCVCE